MNNYITTDMRLAGRVQRYHTWPHLREQSVGEHSWQLARLLMQFYPEAPAHMFAYIVRHDAGELQTGDIPFPTKAQNPVLKKEMDRLEGVAVQEMETLWGMAPSPSLSVEETIIVKICEFVEMWEWALEESLLGNAYAAVVARRCLAALAERTIPAKIAARYRLYMELRRDTHAAIQRRKEI